MEKIWWEDLAACRGVDTKVFFPREHQSDRLAKRICSGCPVRAQCGDAALRSPWIQGVWGGMNNEDRHKIRDRWRPRTDLVRRPGIMQA